MSAASRAQVGQDDYDFELQQWMDFLTVIHRKMQGVGQWSREQLEDHAAHVVRATVRATGWVYRWKDVAPWLEGDWVRSDTHFADKAWYLARGREYRRMSENSQRRRDASNSAWQARSAMQLEPSAPMSQQDADALDAALFFDGALDPGGTRRIAPNPASHDAADAEEWPVGPENEAPPPQNPKARVPRGPSDAHGDASWTGGTWRENWGSWDDWPDWHGWGEKPSGQSGEAPERAVELPANWQFEAEVPEERHPDVHGEPDMIQKRLLDNIARTLKAEEKPAQVEANRRPPDSELATLSLELARDTRGTVWLMTLVGAGRVGTFKRVHGGHEWTFRLKKEELDKQGLHVTKTGTLNDGALESVALATTEAEITPAEFCKLCPPDGRKVAAKRGP